MMMRRFLLLSAILGAASVLWMSSAAAQTSGQSAAQTSAQTPTQSAAVIDPASARHAAEENSKMPKWLVDDIEKYGAVSLFGAFVISGVGLHLSEDLILIPAGWLAAHDMKMFVHFWIWAYLGIVVGDGLWFFMCSTFGTRFLHSKWFKRVLHPRRLLEVKHQIDERGSLVLLAARFIPGTRTPVITMCGLMHMAWWKFLLVELSCVVVTVPLQMLVGVMGARAAKQAGVTDLTHQALVGVAFTLGFVVLMYFVHLWFAARKSKKRAPRAPARWLKLYHATKRLVVRPEPPVAQ
jgi:membrane protein DedA with SNARE-associated domain